MDIRLAKDSDYGLVSPLINEWWGGRDMSHMLPALFFHHFTDTSFIAEQDGQLVGFLVGFLSQSKPSEAYIHFVGVHPEHRKRSIATHLYEAFFDVVRQHGRSIVRCVTSPVNRVSIAYHTRMGFEIEDGDKRIDGVSVRSDYDGPNQDRVLFVKRLR